MVHATVEASEAPSSAAQDELLDALLTFSRVFRAFGMHLRSELGMPSGVPALLRLISRAEQTNVSDVATCLEVDQSVASRQVAWLVESGYAERVVSDEDRRVRVLRLTDAGRELELRVREVSSERVRRAISDWGDDEVATAAAAMRRLGDALGSSVTPASSGSRGIPPY